MSEHELALYKSSSDGMLYCQDENDNENTNATSAKKYGYRDSLLTTPKEANRPYKRPRPSDTPLRY